MPAENGHLDHLLDSYLDGELDGPACRTVETQPRFRMALEQHEAIEASIRRTMSPPAPERLAAIARAAIARTAIDGERTEVPPARPEVSPAAPLRPVWRRRLAVAAAIGLMIAGAWMVRTALTPPPPGPYVPQAFRDMETVYDDVVASGLVPEIVCRDDDEFASWFRRPYGQALRLGELPSSITALGLGYANTISPTTIYVILRVEGTPVIVFVDLLSRDAPPPPLRRDDLHRFRRAIGSLVAYELTPLPAARVLPGVHDPDAAGSPNGS